MNLTYSLLSSSLRGRSSFVAKALFLFSMFSCSPIFAQSNTQSSEYGRRLDLEIQVSAEDIARLANFQPPEENKKISGPMESVTAASERWLGESINAGKDSGPYTMLVILKGKAKATGDVSTLWNSGWDFNDGSARTSAFPGLSKIGVKAGEEVVMSKATSPIRFKESRAVRPLLELVRADNFELESMTVQVWSGVGESSWQDILLSFRWLLGGLVFLLLRWWWVKR